MRVVRGVDQRYDVVIVGGGVGGYAAACVLADRGVRVAIVEFTDRLGGQLTAQAVPSDEHPWIEQCGATRRYLDFRKAVRDHARTWSITAEARARPYLNPGGGWVSTICHPPALAQHLLESRLPEPVDVMLHASPVSADAVDGRVRAVTFATPTARFTLEASVWIDATELGDLLPLAGIPFVTGFEAQGETGEALAPSVAQPDNWQAVTWVFAMAHDPGSHRVIDRPEDYDRWRNYRPEFWPGPLLGFQDVHPITLQPRHLPLFPNVDGTGGRLGLFAYRQIVDPTLYESDAPYAATIVNWPMNDYFVRPILTPEGALDPVAMAEAKTLSRCLLYWLQTEAPRHDGGTGYPGLFLAPSLVGTSDGFAAFPYIRESRRIRARTTITTASVAADADPSATIGHTWPDSVGVGAYRIDLHPSTGGDNYIDVSARPFSIPAGALVPQIGGNVIAGAKNIGTTHLTNGCYRLHPVEWAIGEAAGHLAARALVHGQPEAVVSQPGRVAELQADLLRDGAPIAWPKLHAL
ncbi:MAG: FAD-dependent oxidoreductase [Fimbriimonadaceae bacterium]|nr:FAD-dependent oxidoreductase [Fimbriimonadaceae bacterium]